jgi:L-alanine-DL-glutamate epimerase-like enolase superfamily enzyme
MKIRKITVDVLRVTVDNAYVAAGRQVDANWHVLARVTTADGIEGIGYIVYPRGDLMGAIAQATHALS